MVLHLLNSSPRHLFDQEFLDANCDTSLVPFDSETAVDNTVGTFATNYAIALACIALGLLILLYRRRSSFVIFFIATGIGYGVAGVGHHVTDTSEDEPILVTELVVVFVLLGSAVLGRSAIGVHKILNNIHNLITFGVLAAFVAVTLVLENLIILGIGAVLGPLVLLISLLLIKQKTKMVWQNVGSMVVVIIGYAIQPALAPLCGSKEAYEACFRDCPLPVSFNHNAVFHTVVLIGFVAFGIQELRSPLPCQSQVENSDCDQKVEVKEQFLNSEAVKAPSVHPHIVDP